MSNSTNFALRLPRSIKAAVEEIAKADGTSVNQFVNTAVAEKLAVMRTADYFLQRRSSADLKAFRKVLKRKGGEAPRDGD
jgi:hypothetical protein